MNTPLQAQITDAVVRALTDAIATTGELTVSDGTTKLVGEFVTPGQQRNGRPGTPVGCIRLTNPDTGDHVKTAELQLIVYGLTESAGGSLADRLLAEDFHA